MLVVNKVIFIDNAMFIDPRFCVRSTLYNYK